MLSSNRTVTVLKLGATVCGHVIEPIEIKWNCGIIANFLKYSTDIIQQFDSKESMKRIYPEL